MAARVLLLYRHLLQVAKQWPIDERRPGRVMQPVILERTKLEFRSNRTLVDSTQIATLVAEVCFTFILNRSFYLKGERALALLRDLQNNSLKRQFPVREQPIPDMGKRALKQLAKDADRKLHPERYGLFNRIKAIFTRK